MSAVKVSPTLGWAYHRLIKLQRSFENECESFQKDESSQNENKDLFENEEGREILRNVTLKVFEEVRNEIEVQAYSRRIATIKWRILGLSPRRHKSSWSNPENPNENEEDKLKQGYITLLSLIYKISKQVNQVPESDQNKKIIMKLKHIIKFAALFLRLHQKSLPLIFDEMRTLMKTNLGTFREKLDIKEEENNELTEEIKKYDDIVKNNTEVLQEIENNLTNISLDTVNHIDDWKNTIESELERWNQEVNIALTGNRAEEYNEALKATETLLKNFYDQCFEVMKRIKEVVESKLKILINRWIKGSFNFKTEIELFQIFLPGKMEWTRTSV